MKKAEEGQGKAVPHQRRVMHEVGVSSALPTDQHGVIAQWAERRKQSEGLQVGQSGGGGGK